jgi:hypothetical protein
MNITFIVDGAAVEASGGRVFDRKDPMTGKVATPAAAATVADVDKVVEAAAKAFESWSETGPSARKSAQHPRLGSIRLVGQPIEMSSSRSEIESAAPERGETPSAFFAKSA